MSDSLFSIKFCGMTRREDIDLALSLDVDAIGLIFYDKSARAVTLDKAITLLTDLSTPVCVVAVLVNPTVAFVKQLLECLPINYLQFHGEETPEFCRQFNQPYIKAIPVISMDTVVDAIACYNDAVALLLDTPSLHYGGTGVTFDWNMIPANCQKPLILSGGLTVDNVHEAIRIVNPAAVDVCSGIEADKGVKDFKKMKQFIKRIRG